MKRIVALVLVMIAPSCTDTEGGGTPAGDDVVEGCGLSLMSFSDGEWEFQVDRSWDGSSDGVQLPTDPLSEDDFTPVVDGPDLLVVVSHDGDRVVIGTDGLEGVRAAPSGDLVYYDLGAGTFAGGRFLVWAAEDCLQAELTIFGSGLPVLKSERGGLLPTR